MAPLENLPRSVRNPGCVYVSTHFSNIFCLKQDTIFRDSLIFQALFMSSVGVVCRTVRSRCRLLLAADFQTFLRSTVADRTARNRDRLLLAADQSRTWLRPLTAVFISADAGILSAQRAAASPPLPRSQQRWRSPLETGGGSSAQGNIEGSEQTAGIHLLLGMHLLLASQK